ncbi:MAG: type II toxin-antitoxin system HicB family antitoxin [Pyrinomonadaceae bacterium]
MLNKYIQKALHKAKYEILSDDNTFYGEIPEFQGVYANAATLEDCRDELAEVLEEWIFFRLSKNLPLPVIDGLQLSIQKVA